MSSNKIIIKGVFWSGLQLLINQSFSFLIRLLLAKILFPEQFGIVGMATVFIGFVQVLNDLGMEAAIVQRKADKLKEEHLYTAFWTGLVWGVFLYVIMSFFVAPFAADFYKEPILINLIPVLSVSILSNPINMINRAQLMREMDFRKIAFVENTSSIIAGLLSLALALYGAGVWSLAFNSLSAFLITIPLYFKMTKWKPKQIWKVDAFKDIFGFGIYTSGTSIVNFLINNFDFLIIGKMLNASMLGAYSFAFVLTDTFRGRLMSVVNKVMYPFYGRKQDDPASLKHYYLKVVEYNSIIIYPIMVLLCVFAEPFILVFFGGKWLTSVEPLKILSVSVMVHLMVNSNTSLVRGMGKPRLELILQVIKAFIFIPSIYIGIYYGEIIGAAWAVLLNKVIAVIIAQFTFNKILKLKISTRDFVISQKTPWISSVFMFLVGLLSYSYLNFNGVIVAFLMLIIYSVLTWFLIEESVRVKLIFYLMKVKSKVLRKA